MLCGTPCICIFSLCLIRNHNKGNVSVIWSDPAKYSYWLVLINVCNRGDIGDVIAIWYNLCTVAHNQKDPELVYNLTDDFTI